ncbi:MAG: hydrogenase maturation protease [Elusimicrobiota bacterium]
MKKKIKTSKEKGLKTLIIGIGNPILSDDSIGLKIADNLKNYLSEIDIIKINIMDMSILDLIDGYDRLIIIDSIKTDSEKPGTLFNLKLDDLKETVHYLSPHTINISSIIKLGKELNLNIPKDICVYAVEVKDNVTFSENCTSEINDSIENICEDILKEQFYFNSKKAAHNA